MVNKRIIFIGAGGHGKVVADCAQLLGYQNISFLDSSFPSTKKLCDWDIIGPSDTSDITGGDGFVSIGNNSVRAKIMNTLSNTNFATLVHPNAFVSSSVTLGTGTVLMAGVSVNMDASIGQGVILNTNCSIDHDCKIGDFCHISPGANLAGNVSVGNGSWIGIGASVKEGVTIGKNVIVGAGSVVLNDLPDNITAVGIPAKKVN